MTLSPDVWKSPPDVLHIKQDEVHIWIVDIENNFADLNYYKKFLSSDESEKAARFMFDYDKARYILTHSILRLLVKKYTGIDLRNISFIKGKYNKPALSAEAGSSLCFNLSHSGKYIIYAFTLGSELGIDIEEIKEINDADAIMERFCSDKEKLEYFAIPEEERLTSFFDCWTRKEAYIKATGDGLYFPLNKFSVSIYPGVQPVLIDVVNKPSETDRWKFYNIQVNEFYRSTLAAESDKHKLFFFLWEKIN